MNYQNYQNRTSILEKALDNFRHPFYLLRFSGILFFILAIILPTLVMGKVLENTFLLNLLIGFILMASHPVYIIGVSYAKRFNRNRLFHNPEDTVEKLGALVQILEEEEKQDD